MTDMMSDERHGIRLCVRILLSKRFACFHARSSQDPWLFNELSGRDSGIMSVNDLLFNSGHIHWSLDRCLLAVLPLVFSAPTLDG